MLKIYSPNAAGASCIDDPAIDAQDARLPLGAAWIDMIAPTPAEEAFVERVLGVSIPTRDEMVEIEPSSRLYIEGAATVLTANLLTGVHKHEPMSNAVSFVLTPTALITIRYAEPKAFDTFAAHAGRAALIDADPVTTLVHLLDAVVDRLADSLENVGGEMDNISRSTFRRIGGSQQRMTTGALTVLLDRIARVQDIVSKARDSAVSLARLFSFLAFALGKDKGGAQSHLKSLTRDVTSLTDHATYLGGNITFLLDAALGLISIEQNATIKIFSVAAVIFMPPTLVASIYGMNFKHMPELNFTYGYPMALGFMVLSAVLPYLFFRARGWL